MKRSFSPRNVDRLYPRALCHPLRPVQVLLALLLAGIAALPVMARQSDQADQLARLVKDIRPGAPSSGPEELTNVNGTLFFVTESSVREVPTDLWKSDGTAAGTSLIKSFSSPPQHLTNVAGSLFFTVSLPTTGTELWKSDGTESGTVLVKDIFPGTGDSNPNELTSVDGTLFFTARQCVCNRALWKSDGTEAGTVRVKDIYPPSAASALGAGIAPPDPPPSELYPRNLTNVGGILYFAAYQPATGAELWRSDGSDAGTVLVKDIQPGAMSADPQHIIGVNGRVFFTVGKQLWKSEGTEATTALVKDIPIPEFGRLWSLTRADDLLFFVANSNTTPAALWKSDGTPDGTSLVREFDFLDTWLVPVGRSVFFAAEAADSGRELWKSDGTPAGTTLVKDIRPGTAGSFPFAFQPVNGTLYFQANGTTGTELWKSDGTTEGTIPVQDIAEGAESSFPSELTLINATLFFAAEDLETGRELWSLEISQLERTRVYLPLVMN
jgi:trimeric autotransporter adhesin